LETKNLFRPSFIAPFIVSLVVFLWVFWLSAPDNPVKLGLSIVLAVCCGLVCYFVLNDERFILVSGKSWFSEKKLLVFAFIAFLISFVTLPTLPTGVVYNPDWFSFLALNWVSYVSTLAFTMVIPGYITLKLITGKNQPNQFGTLAFALISVLLSVYISSMFFLVFNLVSKFFVVPDYAVHVAFFIFALLLLIYYLKRKSPVAAEKSGGSKVSLSLAIALIAVVVISVSLIFLQLFVFRAFIRGDSWEYVNAAIFFDKVGFSLQPIGPFYNLGTPILFQIFNSAVFSMSGFPPVNSLMVIGLIIAFLLPIAFYVMCLEYANNRKVALLSTFVYVMSSGFGWIVLVFQKLTWPAEEVARAFSMHDLPDTIENTAALVMNDLTQPHGVVSEGIKTYALAALAVIMLLYLFKANLHSKVKFALIAMLVAFAFQVHIEESLIFVLTFVPAFVFLFYQNKKNVRVNILGVVAGLTLGLSVNILSARGQVSADSIFYGIIAMVALGLFFAFTFMKADTFVARIKKSITSRRKIIFFIVCYVLVICVITLSFNYTSFSARDVSQVVNFGFAFPWFYYPLSLGIAGILAVIGLSMDLHKSSAITFFLVVIPFMIALGILVSYLNVNFFFTGAREWRIIHRVLPIATSAVAGLVIYRFIVYFEQPLQLTRKKRFLKRFDRRYFSAIILTVIILLGIPSTLIASEFWMSTDLNYYARVSPVEPLDFDSAKKITPDLELINYLYQNVHPTERVAVLNETTNGIVRLSGATTAAPLVYPDFLNGRPETIALLSSDVHYVCLDIPVDEARDNYPILKYLPVVFSNTTYTLFEIPYLEPSSASPIGYAAPKEYPDDTLLSYLLISRMGTSYQIVNDDIFNGSIILLPSDIDQSERADSLLNWVNAGGKLVVFGGNGTISDLLGVKINSNNLTTVNASALRVDSQVYSLNTMIPVQPLGRPDANVLSYYSFDDLAVSPFVIEKAFGQGELAYVNVNPLFDAINKNTTNYSLMSGSILSALKRSFEKSNINLESPSTGTARDPVENRWIGNFVGYSQNDFYTIGNSNITVVSDFSGSYLLPQPAKEVQFSFNNDGVVSSLSNYTIYKINVIGNSVVDVHSGALSSVTEGIDSIPNYPVLNFGNSTVKLTLTNGSYAVIEAGNQAGNMSFRVDGSIALNSSALTGIQLAIKQPLITVKGDTHFNGSLTIGDSRITNSTINGSLEFHIAYADNWFFYDLFNYSQYTVDPSPLPDHVLDWNAALPLSILAGLIIFAFAFRKQINHFFCNRKKRSSEGL
jgi:hypothetical protein